MALMPGTLRREGSEGHSGEYMDGQVAYGSAMSRSVSLMIRLGSAACAMVGRLVCGSRRGD